MIKTMLFLSRRNAARTQMAEGLARRMFGPSIRVMSAGTEPGRLDPLAVACMAEVAIDISKQEPKPLRLIAPGLVDLIITVDADDLRPPGFRDCEHMAWPLPQLSELDDADGPAEAALPRYRAVREQLAERMTRLSRVLE